ncbi:MAG TPA: agmatine deiminase family protein, partial [Vampirovibrionales bacterium]
MRELIAEWEKQSAICMAWPHNNSDWADYLDVIETCYLNIAKEISKRQILILLHNFQYKSKEELQTLLNKQGSNLENIAIVYYETNDIWTRDYLPLSLKTKENTELIQFGFNAWGGKYKFDRDSKAGKYLTKNEILKPTNFRQRTDYILEGGSLETNGNGALLTTSNCLLNPNRNPNLSKEEVEEILKIELG